MAEEKYPVASDAVSEPTEEQATAEASVDVSLHGSLISLLARSQLTDVVFLVGDEKIAAHRLVLAAQSVLLEAMLYPTLRKDGTADVALERSPLEA
eukprot:g29857.t1